MEQLKPLLLKLQKNIDRAAIIVFLLLAGLVVFIWNADKADPAESPGDVPTTQMAPHLPNPAQQSVVRNVSWNGQLYAERPVDDSHPFVELVRNNVFVEREPPSDQDIIAQVRQMMQEAQAAFTQANDEADAVLKREHLERAVRLCDQILTVWAAQSGDQQGDARDLRDRAQAQLDALEGDGATP